MSKKSIIFTITIFLLLALIAVILLNFSKLNSLFSQNSSSSQTSSSNASFVSSFSSTSASEKPPQIEFENHTFDEAKFQMKVAKNFEISKVESRVYDDSGKEFYSFNISNKKMTIKIERYLYGEKYKYVNLTGGGGYELSSTICSISEESDPIFKCKDFVLIDEKYKLYRTLPNYKVTSGKLFYQYATLFDKKIDNDEYLIGYIKKSKIQNDLDALTISVELEKGLSDSEKQIYLKIADEMVASIE